MKYWITKIEKSLSAAGFGVAAYSLKEAIKAKQEAEKTNSKFTQSVKEISETQNEILKKQDLILGKENKMELKIKDCKTNSKLTETPELNEYCEKAAENTETLSASIEDSKDKLEVLSQEFKKEPESFTMEKYSEINKHCDNIIINTEEQNISINTLTDYIYSKNNGTNLISTTDIQELKELMSQLSVEELFSILHILGAIVILYSIISLGSVILGNYIIEYFKLENKNTYLTRFIKLRKKFTLFYSSIDILLVVIVLITEIYFNLVNLGVLSI